MMSCMGASLVLLLKRVTRREMSPMRVAVEVCLEAENAEEHEEQWTVRELKSNACMCAGPSRMSWSGLHVV